MGSIVFFVEAGVAIDQDAWHSPLYRLFLCAQWFSRRWENRPLPYHPPPTSDDHYFGHAVLTAVSGLDTMRSPRFLIGNVFVFRFKVHHLRHYMYDIAEFVRTQLDSNLANAPQTKYTRIFQYRVGCCSSSL
jgi:hypothetical protein